MSDVLLAEFDHPKTMLLAARELDFSADVLRDALTPCPVDSIMDLLPQEPSPIRKAMLLAGGLTAAAAYALQAYSAVIAYPLNTGGRPLHSWPVFLLVPIEVAILAAGLCGIISFFMACRLPRLHHAVFEVPGIERASQDRYFLVIETEDETRLRHRLADLKAISVSRVPQP